MDVKNFTLEAWLRAARTPEQKAAMEARYNREIEKQRREHELDVQAAKANKARRERMENEMRYNKIDALMRQAPEPFARRKLRTLAELALANKPRITIKASGLCAIRGLRFETYGHSPDDAYKRWCAILKGKIMYPQP